MCHYIKFQVDIRLEQIEFLLLSHLTFVTLQCLLFCFGVNTAAFEKYGLLEFMVRPVCLFQHSYPFIIFVVLLFRPLWFLFPQVSAPGTLGVCAKSICLVLIALIYITIYMMHELCWVFADCNCHFAPPP